MMACACFSLNSKRAISDSRASLRLLGGADQGDHFVQIIQRLLEAQQNVLAFARLAQFEFGAPPHYLHAVLDEELDHVHSGPARAAGR